ncbi:MAG: DUF4037 domain-containing protein [Clostridia bacterium]|nr:DUF4037 domain-containing protein [Clostridia bacterium]
MNGLERAERDFQQYGLPMIQKEFPEDEPLIAAGLVGEGSECYGFDDEISLDHDVAPGFCLWISDETDERIGERLRASYDRLRSLMGYGTRVLHPDRRGVFTVSSFYRRMTGFPDVPPTLTDWLRIPEHALSVATNGKIFRDPEGRFSAVRSRLAYYPEDVRLKKIAGHGALCAQSGQYNLARCLRRGEKEAAALARNEFVTHAIPLVCALNFTYTPYYKWQFRVLRSLPILPQSAEELGEILSAPVDGALPETVDRFCSTLVAEMKKQGLTDSDEVYLEAHTAGILEHLSSPELSSLHPMDF